MFNALSLEQQAKLVAQRVTGQTPLTNTVEAVKEASKQLTGEEGVDLLRKMDEAREALLEEIEQEFHPSLQT